MNRSSRRWQVAVAICLVVSFAAAAGAAVSPADSLYYAVEAGGASRGWLSLQRLEEADGGVVWRGSGRLEGKGRVSWRLREGKEGQPLAMAVGQRDEEHSLSVQVDLADQRKPKVTVAFDGQQMPVPEIELPAGTVVVPGLVPVAFSPVVAKLAGVDAGSFRWDGQLFNGTLLAGLAITGEGTTELAAGGRTVAARTFAFTITLPGQKQTLEGKLYAAGDGLLLGVDMEDATIRLVSAGGEKTAHESLTLDAAGATLQAVLTVPPRSAGSPPWPAAVLVAGPGQSDADGRVQDHPFWSDLADQLAAQGVVSLRYAEPPVGGADGEPWTPAAVAALRRLVADARIDREACLVLAFGRGAVLLPRIAAAAAADSLPVLGLVALSGVTARAGGPQVPGAAWWNAYAAVDPAEGWREVALPVLLLHGGRDTVVPPDGATALRDSLKGRGVTVSCSVARTLDHTLGKTGADGTWHCSPGLVRQVEAFLRGARRLR